jgi:hypothetical protein
LTRKTGRPDDDRFWLAAWQRNVAKYQDEIFKYLGRRDDDVRLNIGGNRANGELNPCDSMRLNRATA